MTDPSNHTQGLYDAETADYIGPASAEQVAASDESGDTGIFLVDRDGDPIPAHSWDAQQEGVRRVYTI